MAKPTFKFSEASIRDFNATLKSYLKKSKRTLPEALNEKAYFILNGGEDTQGAIQLTHKASKEEISKLMGGTYRTTQKRNTAKKLKKAKLEWGDTSGKYWDYMGVMIVIGKLRRAGKKIPERGELIAMAQRLVGQRLRSIGFIRSGWIPALKRLARFSKYGRIKFGFDNSLKQAGKPKGGVTIATENSPRVIFWNSAGGESKHKGAIMRYGAPALEQAFRDETRSMKAYLERKMREAAHAVGIKTN